MDKIKIQVIIGTVREGRFGDKPAAWITEEAKKIEGAQVEVIDLKDHPVPPFASPGYPSSIKDGNYGNDMINAFAKRIGSADAFIIVTPEYNHGYSGALKDALDSVYMEWNNKPVAFVAYGSVGGARAVEQLRQVAVELQMAPIRAAVHLPVEIFMAVLQEPTAANHPALFAPINEKAGVMLTQLMWWAKALKAARTS
jgi:NAD(P)H-dependent FMN reductase